MSAGVALSTCSVSSLTVTSCPCFFAWLSLRLLLVSLHVLGGTPLSLDLTFPLDTVGRMLVCAFGSVT